MKNTELNFIEDKQDPKAVSVVFRGNLSVENANEFRDHLLGKIDSFEIFNFEINHVETIDLSFYQLLLATKKSIEAKNKQFNLMMMLAQEKLDLLTQAGFDTDLQQ
ncbi:MAG: hypothetical protein K9H16_00130 [Bacteroidales bacterium]|nr:hypothetical protein [Bacteroidales bacterium]